MEEPMKRKQLISLLLVALIALFVFGCGNSDDNNNNDNPLIIDDPQDITSEVADWLVAFVTGEDTKTTNGIVIYYLNATNYPTATDEVELLVDGVSVPVEMYMEMPGFYFGTCDLTEGTTYTIVLKYNGVQKVSTSLKIAYRSSNLITPETYVISEPTNISWTLPSSNDHQFAGVSAYKSNYPNEDDEDEYFVELTPSARAYTIPANAVDNLGTGAEYNIGVTQANYNINNRIAVMSFFDVFQAYGGYVKAADAASLQKKALAMYKALSK